MVKGSCPLGFHKMTMEKDKLKGLIGGFTKISRDFIEKIVIYMCNYFSEHGLKMFLNSNTTFCPFFIKNP